MARRIFKSRDASWTQLWILNNFGYIHPFFLFIYPFLQDKFRLHGYLQIRFRKFSTIISMEWWHNHSFACQLFLLFPLSLSKCLQESLSDEWPDDYFDFDQPAGSFQEDIFQVGGSTIGIGNHGNILFLSLYASGTRVVGFTGTELATLIPGLHLQASPKDPMRDRRAARSPVEIQRVPVQQGPARGR